MVERDFAVDGNDAFRNLPCRSTLRSLFLRKIPVKDLLLEVYPDVNSIAPLLTKARRTVY